MAGRRIWGRICREADVVGHPVGGGGVLIWALRRGED